MHTRPLTPSFQDTVVGGMGGKRENRRSSAPGTREWGQGAPAQGRNRTRRGRHASALGVEDWGPRYFRGRLRSLWTPQTPRPVTQELSSTLGLLHPALTRRPGRGCSLNNLSRPRLQLYRRACWGQGWATRYQPPAPGPGCPSFPQQRSPKPPGGTEIPRNPGASMAEAKGADGPRGFAHLRLGSPKGTEVSEPLGKGHSFPSQRPGPGRCPPPRDTRSS